MFDRSSLNPSRVRAALPSGQTLPEEDFRRRHTVLLALLWLHVPVLVAWALARGFSVPHTALEGSLVALPAALATWVMTDRKRASALVAFGLISCSAVVVHLADGYIEAHFHFFVMIVALTLYEDWVPFLLAAAYVLLHHGVAGVIDPHAVYNHPQAIAHPWRWAGIHAGFVAAAGGAGIMSWRLSETTRQERERALLRAQAAEAEARRAAAELEQSNRDLEQFAYVASHDLSEPLRTLSSFLGLLQRRYTGKLDAQGDELIDYAVDGAARMQRLIDDLLQFSRAGREELDSASVQLEDVVDDVLVSLRARIEESGAHIEVARPLGAVRGDPAQLRQVLQNLLSNALKFVADGPPVVHVTSASLPGGVVCLSVRDNGVGIAPGKEQEVFQMFERGHSRDEFEGTGIGLSIVQRIVERHGGEVWVEPVASGGSAFFVTLPAGEPGPAARAAPVAATSR